MALPLARVWRQHSLVLRSGLFYRLGGEDSILATGTVGERNGGNREGGYLMWVE